MGMYFLGHSPGVARADRRYVIGVPPQTWVLVEFS